MDKKFLKLLPSKEVSVERIARFYKYEDALGIYEDKCKGIKHSYMTLIFVYIITITVTVIAIKCDGKDISDLLLTTAIFIISFTYVYKMRYSSIDRLIKRSANEIIDDLPEMMDKVVLLLNAGLFVEAAIIKIIEDHEKNNKEIGTGTLLSGMSNLKVKAEESNASIVAELGRYSIKTGVRELIRFSTLVENNYDKGSDLAEKLENEGMLLWMNKRKRAEEKAKLASTKLSLPLMLLLLSLIIITSAPMLLCI